MRFLALIPARYASTRFPGKPLAILGGKTIIQQVYERVKPLFEETYVATDDERIYNTVVAFGGKAIMTSSNHKTGTDRCQEAATKIGADKFDVVVNIQGDEPFIHPSQINAIKECFANPKTQIATLVKPFTPDTPIETLENPNTPKVIFNQQKQAIYFSRSVIPYPRGIERDKWTTHHTFYKHIGLYAYLTETLKEITQLQQSPLEITESLEQLRWIENGYHIQIGITHIETIGIDTPEDLEKANQYYNSIQS